MARSPDDEPRRVGRVVDHGLGNDLATPSMSVAGLRLRGGGDLHPAIPVLNDANRAAQGHNSGQLEVSQ